MDRVVIEVRIPITVPDVEVTSHDYSVFNVSNVVMQCLQGYLLTIGVDVDNEVDVLVIMEHQDVDVLMINNISIDGES